MYADAHTHEHTHTRTNTRTSSVCQVKLCCALQLEVEGDARDLRTVLIGNGDLAGVVTL